MRFMGWLGWICKALLLPVFAMDPPVPPFLTGDPDSLECEASSGTEEREFEEPLSLSVRAYRWIQRIDCWKQQSESLAIAEEVLAQATQLLEAIQRDGLLTLEAELPWFLQHQLFARVADLYQISFSQSVFLSRPLGSREKLSEVLTFLHWASRFYEKAWTILKNGETFFREGSLESKEWQSRISCLSLKFYMLCIAVEPYASYFKHQRQYLWYVRKKQLLSCFLKQPRYAEVLPYSLQSVETLVSCASQERRCEAHSRKNPGPVWMRRHQRLLKQVQTGEFTQNIPHSRLSSHVRLKLFLFEKSLVSGEFTRKDPQEVVRQWRALEALLVFGQEQEALLQPKTLEEAYRNATGLLSDRTFLNLWMKVVPFFLEAQRVEEALVRFRILEALSSTPLPFVAQFAMANLRHSLGDGGALLEVHQILWQLKESRVEEKINWLRTTLTFQRSHQQKAIQEKQQQVAWRLAQRQKRRVRQAEKFSGGTQEADILKVEPSRLQEKHEKWLRHQEREQARQIQREEKEPERALISSDEEDLDTARDVPSRAFLAYEYAVESTVPSIRGASERALKRSRRLRRRVEAEIDAQTWGLTREEIEAYCLQLGCTLRRSRGSHRKVTLPELVWVEKDGEVLPLFSEWVGMLILPKWTDQVPFYLRRSLQLIRDRWGTPPSGLSQKS